MRPSRYDLLERRAEPARALGRQAARLAGRQRNPYDFGTPQYWAWKEGHDSERQPQPTGQRRRPASAARRTGGTTIQSLAQLAGALSNNTNFQRWCGAADADEAAAWIRAACGVTSRSELDTNPEAARLFHDRVRRPFAASRDQ